MSGVVENKLLLYADDSAILVAEKNISTVETLLQRELEVVSDWLIGSYRYTWVKPSRFCLVPNRG